MTINLPASGSNSSDNDIDILRKNFIKVQKESEMLRCENTRFLNGRDLELAKLRAENAKLRAEMKTTIGDFTTTTHSPSSLWNILGVSPPKISLGSMDAVVLEANAALRERNAKLENEFSKLQAEYDALQKKYIITQAVNKEFATGVSILTHKVVLAEAILQSAEQRAVQAEAKTELAEEIVQMSQEDALAANLRFFQKIEEKEKPLIEENGGTATQTSPKLIQLMGLKTI